MTLARRTSLARLHPWRLHVPFGLVATLLALALGFRLPLMHVRKVFFWRDEYTLVSGVVALFRNGDMVVGSIIAAFCIAFPVAKILAMLYVWFIPTSTRTMRRVLGVTRIVGKWSMLDVFAVAMFIVLATTNVLARFSPRIGLYVLAGAVLATMVLTLEIERVSRRYAAPGKMRA